MTKKLESETLRVTPTLAREWLESFNYSDNRPISMARVRYYARQIKTGRWQLNGQPVIFDARPANGGRLLNGQHRLKAITLADKAIELLVVYGVAAEAFTTMDQTYTRSGGQVLGMAGHGNPTVRAAICRALYAWETANGSYKDAARKIAPDELLLVQDCYGTEIDAAVDYCKAARKVVPIPAGILGLAYVVFHRARPRKADAFFEVLETGLADRVRHPARVLREKLIQDKFRDRELEPKAKWCALIRAWNHHEKGSDVASINVQRGADGEWVEQPVRGLGRRAVGGQLTGEADTEAAMTEAEVAMNDEEA